MTPRTISQFWLRRLCETALAACLALLVLYMWARFIPTGYQLPIGMAITDLAAAVAGVSSIILLILCFWFPQKHHAIAATAAYGLLVIVIATTICTSGCLSSPFASAWPVVAMFASFFGPYVTLAMAGLIVIELIIIAVPQGIDLMGGIAHVLFGLAPLLLSFILWHRQPQKLGNDPSTELAHRLSHVEGKSDIVINAINDGVIAINMSGVIELINPSAQTLTGWNQGDALGLSYRSVLKLVNAEGREVTDNEHPIALALNQRKAFHSDKLFVLTGSDKKRLVHLMCSPVGQGEDGVIVVFRDITKEKAEEREQAEFISTASHEMRTPVASIEGYLGLALNPATAQIDEKARDFITKAHQSAQHLGRLFQDLLDISRAEDGRLKHDPHVIDVVAFTGDIWGGLAQQAQTKQLSFIFRPQQAAATDGDRRLQPVFYAYVDADHFREVVANLIENAIKYTPSGQVVVDVTGDDTLVTVSVADSGIGIPAEDIPHLFQKFYRVDNSDTREIGGTGLGLYLCRRLAESMGGQLRVESEYKKGSTFFLDIPRISHEEATHRIHEQAAVAQKATTVSAPTAAPLVGMTIADIEQRLASQPASTVPAATPQHIPPTTPPTQPPTPPA